MTRRLPDERSFLLPRGRAFVANDAVVVGDVELGEEASIWYGAVLRADDDRIVVGPRANLQDRVVAHPMPGQPLVIGRECVVGHGAILHLAELGERCLVGMGAILLAGARLGPGCIVAAGAVVREGSRIPPRSLVAGVPARMVRSVTDEEAAAVVEAAKDYVAKARLHLRPSRDAD